MPQRHAATETAGDRARPCGPPPARAGRAPRRAPDPGSGRGIPRDGPSSTRSPAAARPARPGRRCPGPAGQPRSPAPPHHRERRPRHGHRRTRRPRPGPRRRRAGGAGRGGGARRRRRPAATATAVHVTLTADLGPAERYRRWLAALRGETLIVAGTRAAMFAPVRDLGLVVLWDDGDDLHAEPRAPYPHAREVLALRAHRAGAAALIGGFARTAEMTQLVAGGLGAAARTRPADAARTAPRVRPAADDGRTRPGRGRHHGAAADPGTAHRQGSAAGGPGTDPGATARLPRRDRLRPVPCARPVHAPGSAAGQAGMQRPAATVGSRAAPDCRWCGALATGTGRRLALPALRSRQAARHHHRRHPHRGRARPRLPRRARSARPAATWCSRTCPASLPW